MDRVEIPREILKLPAIGAKCYYCSKANFISTKLGGGDYTTCPICGNGDGDVDYDYDLHDAEREMSHYCDSCAIVYRLGCVHSAQGCTDTCYYGQVVKSFEIGREGCQDLHAMKIM